jgi:N-carbamoyl-L-amino-acid hydrolase
MSGTNQRIDGRRLWDSLMAMARHGATPKGGVRRLTLTEIDRDARDDFRAQCEALGLVVRVDAIGNMFARRQGRDPDRPPVLFGSHLDSQPSGGKYDGALGVVAGLEVMRTLNDLGLATEAPLELVNWTDEEGSRFGYSLMGSGTWAGIYPLAQSYALRPPPPAATPWSPPPGSSTWWTAGCVKWAMTAAAPSASCTCFPTAAT